MHGFYQPVEKPAGQLLQMQQVADGKPDQQREHDRRHSGRLDDGIDTDRDRAHAEHRRQVVLEAAGHNMTQTRTDHTAE